MTARLPTLPDRPFEDYPALPFREIREKLDDLLVATANLLERQWPAQGYPGELRTLLVGTVKITEVTYRSIRYLCADIPEDPTRRPEFAISVPPLARTILDSVFTVIFILDDVRGRMDWYGKSGWREICAEYDRHAASYNGDPDWEDYLDAMKAYVDYGQQEFNVTAAEASDPKLIPWWPNPVKMIPHSGLAQSRKDFLQYLNDWFYKGLSADSHLSWPGFARRAAHLLNPDEEQRDNLVRKYRSDCVVTSIVLIMCLLSEVEAEFSFGRAERLREVWGRLVSISGDAKEVFDLRYVTRLLDPR